MTPMDMVLERLPDARTSGVGWSARCPSHDDQHASLSVSEGDDGRALVYCHAQCSFEAILSALGLTARDVMPNGNKKGRTQSSAKYFSSAEEAIVALEAKHGKRSATWIYQDAAGHAVGQTIRWDRPHGKEIRPISRTTQGWQIRAMASPRPLFGLPTLADAVSVVVVEGEACAEAVDRLGLTATTSAGGAAAAKFTDWSPLAKKTVWILPDNDNPGRKYAHEVAGILESSAKASEVKIVALPHLPPGGDIIDWIHAQGEGVPTTELQRRLMAIFQSAPRNSSPQEMSANTDWPEPIFRTSSQSQLVFPIDVFPEGIRAFVAAVAEEKQVPLDLPAMLALGVAAGGLSRKVTVTPLPGWIHEPVNLFVMCVLPPGERKSQTFSAMLGPVHQLERQWQKVAAPVIRKVENDLRLAQKRVDILESKIAKSEVAAKRNSWLKELEDARKELDAIEVPIYPIVRVDDDTPEMLACELVKQNGRLMAASPEARTLENIQRYAKDLNIDVFLKGHAGDDLRSGRVGRGRDAVDRTALTCLFTPQPCVIQKLSSHTELLGRGFLARWFYSFPQSLVGFRQIGSAAVPEDVSERYQRLITDLWQTTYATESGDHHVLRLSSEAEEGFKEFERWKESELRPGGLLSQISSWANKLGGLCIRLAGILHVSSCLDRGEEWQVQPISWATVQSAIRIARDYALPHALRAFDVQVATPELAQARTIFQWIWKRSNCHESFTQRDVFNGCRGRLKTVLELEPGLTWLQQHALIRLRAKSNATARDRPGRKPSPEFEVNPRLNQANVTPWLLGTPRPV
jgi:hypothetical protein